MINESDILNRLREGLAFPPLSISTVNFEVVSPTNEAKRSRADAVIEATWGERRYRFIVEAKAYSSPKILRETIWQAKDTARRFAAFPMIFTTWLPPEQLDELERERVSGIDLNGNGIVVIPNELLVYRTGKMNSYPRTLPIRKVYQGGSSIVPRVLLVRPQYESVNQVRDEIRRRFGTIALSTISRVLQQLTEDLSIARESRCIRLIQPDKLLQRLAENYAPPKIISRYTAKSPSSVEEIGSILGRFAQQADDRFVSTGAASVNQYGVMARESVLSLYCDRDPAIFLRMVGVQAEPTDRFPNLELLQTSDDVVYFDRRGLSNGVFASPIQSWLELATGEKRQRSAAEQVQQTILSQLASSNGTNEQRST